MPSPLLNLFSHRKPGELPNRNKLYKYTESQAWIKHAETWICDVHKTREEAARWRKIVWIFYKRDWYVHRMILLLSNETTQWIESDHVLFLHWFSCRYNANHQPLILLFDLQTEGGNNSGLHSCPDAVNYCSYQTFRCLLIERASVSLSLPLLADNNYAWMAAFNCLCTNVT